MSNNKIKSRIIMPGNGGGGPPKQPVQEIRLTESQVLDLENVKCPKCGGKLFEPCFVFKKLPAVHPGNIMSVNKLVPVSTYRCSGVTCGAEFGSDEVKGCFE